MKFRSPRGLIELPTYFLLSLITPFSSSRKFFFSPVCTYSFSSKRCEFIRMVPPPKTSPFLVVFYSLQRTSPFPPLPVRLKRRASPAFFVKAAICKLPVVQGLVSVKSPDFQLLPLCPPFGVEVGSFLPLPVFKTMEDVTSSFLL